jgi:hypothetical protein
MSAAHKLYHHAAHQGHAWLMSGIQMHVVAAVHSSLVDVSLQGQQKPTARLCAASILAPFDLGCICGFLCRTYTYTVRGNATGNLTNLVLLTRVDTNTSNNNATSTVTVLGTCGNPFGNGTKLSCPTGNVFNSSLDNTTITSLAQFNTTCCVSVLAGVCWRWSGATWSELPVECQ